MTPRLMLFAVVLSGVLTLGNAGPAQAQRGTMSRPVMSRPTMSQPMMSRPTMGTYYHPQVNYGFHPNNAAAHHMPGWDWWRTYPWSPYNAWRNPYWYPPYNNNYPYAPYEANMGNYTYPYYAGGTAYYSGYSGQTPPDEGTPTEPQQRVVVPHPTGAVQTPPPNAAVVRVYLPDSFGTVMFDGQKSSSVGTTRYYVTPDLQAGKNYTYSVSATFNRNGQSVTEDRSITVAPGHTTVVDFNKAK